MNIELFPCSGGFAEGFRRAGIIFDLAIEKDSDACDSYEKNHGHRPVQMDAIDFLRMVREGWRPAGGVRFLCADPPCTPWSRAGKREGLADPRDCLAATAELISILRPRAYLIGNVPGLQDSTSWGVVQKVIGGLAAHGYCVKDYASLDAADYGVPQHRVRPFWFGHLAGPCVRWPAPTHAAPSGQLAIGGAALAPWVTCRQALRHLSLEELGRPVRMKIRDKGEDGTRHGGDVTRCSAPDKVATTVMARQNRKGGQIMITGADDSVPTEKKRWLPNGGDESLCSAPDKPAATVGAHEGIKGGQVLLVQTDGHPAARADAPAPTVRSGGAGHSAPQAVLLADSLASTKKRKRGPAQAQRVADLDAPAPSIVGAGETSQSLLGIVDGLCPRCCASAITAGKAKAGEVCQACRSDGVLLANDKHPMSRIDEPAMTVTAHLGATGAAQGGAALFVGAEHPRHPISDLDDVSRTVRTNGGRTAGAASMLRLPEPSHSHPPSSSDQPARAILADGGRAGNRSTTLLVSELVEPRPDCHPISDCDEPSNAIVSSMPGNGGAVMRLPDPLRPPGDWEEPHRTITRGSEAQAIMPIKQPLRGARVGAGPGQALEWPWDRPSTTILGDELLSVPGHHDASVGNASHKGPNAVVLSERAAAILQGFPEDWLFSGKTKRTRWSQIGQAMPPPLAHAVARGVAEQLAATLELTSEG